jgi:uncharacterized protein YqeY
MTALKDRIQEDLHAAMRAGDETRKSTLRMLSAAVHNAEIDARRPLDEAGVLAVVQKQAKQRRESIVEFEKGKRADLAAKEQAELEVLQAYLPAEASRDEIERAAREVIAETGASGPRDIGRVMPVLVQKFAGRADGRAISEVVRALLGS